MLGRIQVQGIKAFSRENRDLNQGLDSAKADENSSLSLLHIALNISCTSLG